MRQLYQFLIVVSQAVFFWTVAFCFFIVIRYFALNEEQGVTIVPEYDVPIVQWMHFGIIVGVLVGFFFGVMEFFYDKFLAKRLPLILSFIIKSVVYLILLVISTTIIITIAEIQMDLDLPNEDGWWIESRIFWLVVFYFWTSCIVFFLLKFAYERYNYSVFLNSFFGRYRNPKEEKRIFMFIDLNDSTAIAENLGHYKYSELIRDFFNDLNIALESYGATVYQYVGDEAVITWTYKKGIKNSKCVKFFFDFENQIEKHSEYYIQKFGLVPSFKAGLHGGNVMVTEVGLSTIKKELAYHGDVLNSTSRILTLCKSYNTSFIISEDLWTNLPIIHLYNAAENEPVTLRGKAGKTKTYSLSLK